MVAYVENFKPAESSVIFLSHTHTPCGCSTSKTIINVFLLSIRSYASNHFAVITEASSLRIVSSTKVCHCAGFVASRNDKPRL